MAIYTRDKEGVLSPLNIRAIKGKDGKNGIDGVTPNITIGEVTTLEAGEEATVNISGTKENPVLNFGIPKGEDGTNGNINIDDENVSKNTTWSSDKTDKEVKKSNESIKELETKNEEQDKRIKEIEDTGKLQDFYINGLFNENTDKRISVEEEGNEIKLEGSKKGFVEIDKIVGNTLVNRVNEPMRNLTLNGDIDEEGTFVTTNEGVQHGLVDVVCEGNTLVNLAQDGKKRHDNVDWVASYPLNNIKNSTVYTVFFKLCNVVNPDNIKIMHTSIENTANNGMAQVPFVNGIQKSVITTRTNSETNNPNLDVNKKVNFCAWILNNNRPKQTTYSIQNVIVLEGDYSDKPIPTEYFEGMKSVGEQADGNHKVEIISKNKNLCTVNSYSGKCHNKIETNIPCKKNTNYTLIFKDESDINQAGKRGMTIITHKTKTNKTSHGDIYQYSRDEGGKEYSFKESGYTFNTGDCCYISLTSNNMYSIPNLIFQEIQLEEGTQATSYVSHTSNKKELSVQEPLRGLPNGVKDRFVKIDGKWFIKRNCGEYILNEDALTTRGWSDDGGSNRYIFTGRLPNMKSGGYVYSDKIPYTNTEHNSKYLGIHVSSVLDFGFPEGAETMTLQEKKEILKPYLQNGGLKIVYELADTIYEPLDITPELVCYDEVTHISNDSLIPCNMVVKNTGFSCIPLLKDGTYTTFHNGGEGITSKVDTTNNIVRFSGKGKNISDVMVLDGNVSKTYGKIEGMKSTFEDKLVTQEMVDDGLEKAENLGKYKVDITVRGKNLKNLNTVNEDWGGGQFNTTISQNNNNYHSCETFDVSDLRGKTIYTGTFRNGKPYHTTFFICIFDKNKKLIGGRYELGRNEGYEVPYNAHYMRFMSNCGSNNSLEAVKTDKYAIATEPFVVGETYEPHYEYTTSVYLNSPLLKGDEIVVKEGQLGIMHNVGKELLTESSIKSGGLTANKNIVIVNLNSKLPFDTNNTDIKKVLCDKLTSVTNYYLHGHEYYSFDSIGITFDKFLRATLTPETLGVTRTDNNLTIMNSVADWIRKNNPTIIYELAEPYFEPIISETPKWLLDIPNTATLHIDTIVPCQTIKANYTGKIPSLYGMENTISTIDEYSISMVASNFDMDYRLLEIEWALENAGITGIDIMNILNIDGMKSINLTRYEQAKIMITSGVYNKNTLTRQLNRYLEKNIITKEEFDELIELMK